MHMTAMHMPTLKTLLTALMDLLQRQGKDGYRKTLNAISARSDKRNLDRGRFFGRFFRLVYKLARQIQGFPYLVLKH